MAVTAKDIIKRIKEENIQMVDFKMVDINGQFRHVTIPARNFTEATMTEGIGFDASNYGYAVVEKSDMVFIPDPETAQVDPFCDVPTLSMTGNAMIIDYPHNRPLDQYPRNIVLAAENYMRRTGVADTMLILPEFEFYLFDSVTWDVRPDAIGMTIDAEQAHWNSGVNGTGAIVPRQGHYHIAKPLDRTYECRSEMCMHIEAAGTPVKYHHPEVGGAGQFEIEPMLGEMSKMADATMMIKYIIPNSLAPIIVQGTLGVANAILTIASLSFVGLGVQPPTPEWGAMLSSARTYMREAWHITVFPGIAVMLAILSLNLMGDGLRDALDPKLKN